MNHRHNTSIKLDDDERSEGELDSSLSDNDDDNNEIFQSQQTSQSWTKILTDQNLSSIMSNALVDNTEIIHIDDPIAQQSTNPLTYVFPPGTNINEYFQRKKKQDLKLKHKPNRHDLKNLSHLLNNEKNEDLLRAILDIIGCQRTFQYAHEAIRLYNAHDSSIIIKSDNGQIRTLGGIYFKMLIKDNDNNLINEYERNQIKKRNQEIQKIKKKKKTKKINNKNSMKDN
ncbi:unnamed protein product [Rotaria sp. Silwood1]|nr:unnamed protein product [Rotaria sp. Silwood1]CAF1668570.1 unnamed protein product [Rotaria sp. Silwood1]